MSNNENPIYKYELASFKIEVFTNRVVVYTPGTFNVINEKIIPIRSITNIRLQGLTKKVEIDTMDGKTHQLSYLWGENAIEFRNILLKLL